MENTPPSSNSAKKEISATAELLARLVFFGVLAIVAWGGWRLIPGRYKYAVLPDRYRYALQYDIPTEHVFVSKKPTDCDFMHAPLGKKDCHYEKHVVQRDANGKEWITVRFSKPIDQLNLSGLDVREMGTVKITDVYVKWEKVNEQ